LPFRSTRPTIRGVTAESASDGHARGMSQSTAPEPGAEGSSGGRTGIDSPELAWFKEWLGTQTVWESVRQARDAARTFRKRLEIEAIEAAGSGSGIFSELDRPLTDLERRRIAAVVPKVFENGSWLLRNELPVLATLSAVGVSIGVAARWSLAWPWVVAFVAVQVALASTPALAVVLLRTRVAVREKRRLLTDGELTPEAAHRVQRRTLHAAEVIKQPRFSQWVQLSSRLALAGEFAVVVTGLAAAATVVTIAYPGWVASLGIVAALTGFSLLLALMMQIFLTSAWQALVPPRDPCLYLIEQLLIVIDVIDRVREGYGDGLWPSEARVDIAAKLERAAVRMQRDATFSPWLRPTVGFEARAASAARGRAVARWLREIEFNVLWPSLDGWARTKRVLVSGLVAACIGDWPAVAKLVAHEPRDPLLRRILPRVAVAAALGLAAWLVPVALGNAVSAGGASTLRVTFALMAVGSLVAPEDAVSDALKQLGELGSRQGPG